MYSDENLGSYNPVNRRGEIQAKLSKELGEAHVRIMKYVNAASENETISESSGNGDLLTMKIERFVEEVHSFQEEVKEFQGPCFNKQYRALVSRGQNLQCELDKLDLSNVETIRQQRKDLLREIDSHVRQVKSKVHPDGRVCDKCKISVL